MNGKLVLLAGAVVLAACGAEEAAPEPEAAPAVVEVQVAEPDTTGAAMWAHIQESGYQENWELWPEMGEFYTGNAPHGMLLTTRVNSIALQALNAGETVMPAGAVVIKENYMPDRQLAAVTVMYKRPGYNPEHNDWFFTKHLPDGSLDKMPNGMEMEGRLPGCQGCHIAKKDADYLYTPRPTEGSEG